LKQLGAISGASFLFCAKLTPDVTNIVEIAAAVLDAGADGVALINTVLGMVIDIDSMRPKLAGKTGGLSGPAIRPVAVRAIFQVREAFPNIPIIGMGGVASGRDALELVLAGANAVSVGTATFGNPKAVIKVKDELENLLINRGFTNFTEAVGYAHREGN
jgi:dihydroorotate dehydrogenase (NAD+) catalytic subunit